MLIQSGDEKYPDMVKVLSAAQHYLVWRPECGTIKMQTVLVPLLAVGLQQDQDKPMAHVSGSEHAFYEKRNNCEI